MEKPIGPYLWKSPSLEDSRHPLGWTEKRLLIGLFIPPLLALVMLYLIVLGPEFFRTELAHVRWDYFSMIFVGTYLVGSIPSILGTLFMEWIGRGLFETKESFNKAIIIAYIAIGTALGAVAVLALGALGVLAMIVFEDLDISKGAIKLGVHLLLASVSAGLILSLIMLLFWRAELESNYE